MVDVFEASSNADEVEDQLGFFSTNLRFRRYMKVWLGCVHPLHPPNKSIGVADTAKRGLVPSFLGVGQARLRNGVGRISMLVYNRDLAARCALH